MIIKTKKGVEILVDDDIDRDILLYTWYVNSCRGIQYVVATVWNKKLKKNSRVAMHRLIAKANTGEIVDHINGDTLDNRLCNLRISTIKENVRNSKIYKNNTNGYKGVSLEKKSKVRPYKVLIQVDRKKIYIGLFKTKKEAALAYNEAAIKYFGEFARLNIIKE